MAVETSTVQVVMPAMGDSVAEGTVLEWHKQEGDRSTLDETIVEISTDKVDAEVPSPAAGTLVKIHAAEGDTVAVGALLAEISTETATRPTSRPATPGRPRRVTAATPRRPSPAPPPRPRACGRRRRDRRDVDIVTPTGGESVTEGTILEWSVKVGDAVKDGDTVVEISTDKVDMELPAPASGTITEILLEEGETVTVGQVIARMTAGAAAPAAAAPSGTRTGYRTSHAPPRRPAPPPRRRRRRRQRLARRPPRRRRRRASISGVQGSARGGRITKADVLAAAGNGRAPRQPGRPVQAARQQPPGAPARLSGGAARRSRATWTRAARSRRRRRSAR